MAIPLQLAEVGVSSLIEDEHVLTFSSVSAVNLSSFAISLINLQFAK
ncbi:MAG: hypothetical protein WBJ29_01910 [Fervidobacterium sp.]